MSRRADRKRAQKRFKVGDLVTWGNGSSAHVVVEVTETGVIVDVTDARNVASWSTPGPDGRYRHFVAFGPHDRGHSRLRHA